MHTSLPTPAPHRPFPNRHPLVDTPFLPPPVWSSHGGWGGEWGSSADGDGHGQDHLWLPPPQAPSIWSRAPTPTTSTHTNTHRPIRPCAQTPPAAPPRPLRAPPPVLTTPHAARSWWREAAASGRFDFPAAWAPRSRSQSRGGGACNRVPSPAAACAKSQREAAQPRRSGLHAARVRPPSAAHASLSPAPLLPHPKLYAPLHDSAHPSLCPSPAAPHLPGLFSAWPPASSRPPHPLVDPRPPLPPPPFPLSLPTPPLCAPLSSLCRPASTLELGESPVFQLLRRRRESRRARLIWVGGRGGRWSSLRTWRR